MMHQQHRSLLLLLLSSSVLLTATSWSHQQHCMVNFRRATTTTMGPRPGLNSRSLLCHHGHDNSGTDPLEPQYDDSISSVSLSSIHMDNSANSKQIRMGLCNVAVILVVPVVLLFHPLPAHAKLDAGDIQQIQVLLEKNNKELLGDMEKNNKELRSELGLYPLLTAAFSVTATTITTTINSNKLDDTLKRFDDKKDGIQAGLEPNVFRSGLLGAATYSFLAMAMFVVLKIAQSPAGN